MQGIKIQTDTRQRMENAGQRLLRRTKGTLGLARFCWGPGLSFMRCQRRAAMPGSRGQLEGSVRPTLGWGGPASRSVEGLGHPANSPY